MTKLKIFSTLAASMLLNGCMTVPSYQAAGANGVHRVGYSETRLMKNVYRVKYLGKDSQSAYKNFYRRSSELTIENGYSYFVVSDLNQDREQKAGSLKMSAWHSVDLSIPKYEGTVTMYKDQRKDSVDAREFLNEISALHRSISSK